MGSSEHVEQNDVRRFMVELLGLELPDAPEVPAPDVVEFRRRLMQEELDEFTDACQRWDLCDAADALVDLAYVVHGTAIQMGLPWDELWREVQRANMSKRRAKSAAESKRGHAFDAVKPQGWKAPDHRKALGMEGMP